VVLPRAHGGALRGELVMALSGGWWWSGGAPLSSPNREPTPWPRGRLHESGAVAGDDARADLRLVLEAWMARTETSRLAA